MGANILQLIIRMSHYCLSGCYSVVRVCQPVLHLGVEGEVCVFYLAIGHICIDEEVRDFGRYLVTARCTRSCGGGKSKRK